MNQTTVISIEKLRTNLGGTWVHRGISIQIKRGEIIAIVGGSGSGKSTLLRIMLSLLPITEGEIRFFSENIKNISAKKLLKIQRRCGVLFQQSALFGSLTVLENIAFPLKQFTNLNPDTIKEIALLKLALVGLETHTADKFPSELSGGMQKRVALARAIALDPEVLFLDEPSSGLDPVSAAAQDKLLLQLQQAMQLTIVMVTHDLNTIATIVDRSIFLGEGKVLAEGSFKSLQKDHHPEVHAYFHTTRAAS